MPQPPRRVPRTRRPGRRTAWSGLDILSGSQDVLAAHLLAQASDCMVTARVLRRRPAKAKAPAALLHLVAGILVLEPYLRNMCPSRGGKAAAHLLTRARARDAARSFPKLGTEVKCLRSPK